jgi:hypothetical protein
MKDIPKETSRKKAERKWANNDLRRRFKEAREKDAPELEPPKPTVTTVINPYFDEQKELNKLVEINRKKFILQMRKLVNEGREQGIKKYKLSIEAQKRRYLIAKYKLLLRRQREIESCAAK